MEDLQCTTNRQIIPKVTEYTNQNESLYHVMQLKSQAAYKDLYCTINSPPMLLQTLILPFEI